MEQPVREILIRRRGRRRREKLSRPCRFSTEKSPTVIATALLWSDGRNRGYPQTGL